MSRLALLSALVLMQLLYAWTTPALAGTNITWKVLDNGGVEKCSGTGNLTLAYIKKDPCDKISILDGAQAARITSIDGNADVMTMQYTKIRANADVSGWHLIFEKELDAAPTGATWWYVTRIIGNLDNTDSTNAITVNAKMYNPLGNQNTNSTLSVTASEYQPFNKLDGPKVNPALNNLARKIVVDLSLTLKNGKTVDFGYAGAYIQVRAQATAPDCEPGDTCEPSESSLMQQFLQSLQESKEACLGLRFADASCAGVHMMK